MDNKFEAILREIKTNKNASTVTNPRSEVNEIQDSRPSGSKTQSIGVHASNNENSDSEIDDRNFTLKFYSQTAPFAKRSAKL